LSQKLAEEPENKTGGEVAPDFDSKFGGTEATGVIFRRFLTSGDGDL